MSASAFWVAVRRTYVFTLQEVEKICWTLRSHVMQHQTINYLAVSSDSNEAELLFQGTSCFFQSRSWHKLHKILI